MAEPSINTQSTPESTQVEPLDKDDRLATEVEHENSQHDANPSSDGSPDLEKGSRDDGPSTADRNRFFVEFDGPNDPDNPKSWTPKRRWAITISMGLMVFTVTFASSIFSVNISVVQEKFSVELVTATLGVALFVLVGWPSAIWHAGQKLMHIAPGIRFRTNSIRAHVRSVG